MNPNQPPQDPLNVPPASVPTPAPTETPAPQPTPQPAANPFAPASPFATSESATPVQQPVAPTTGYGSGTMSSPVDGATAPVTAPIPVVSAKKGLNKKLLIIIGAIIVVLIIVGIIFIALKPGSSSNGGVIGALKATVAPASQLATYNGTAFSFSYPKTFKSVDISASIPAGSEGARYSSDGTSAGDGTVSTVGAVSTPYTATSTKSQLTQTFESSVGTKVADTAQLKDVTYTKMTYQGFEAVKGTGTILKNGTTIAQSKTLYIFGNKNLYIISTNVNTADASTLGAEDDAIFASLKINE